MKTIYQLSSSVALLSVTAPPKELQHCKYLLGLTSFCIIIWFLHRNLKKKTLLGALILSKIKLLQQFNIFAKHQCCGFSFVSIIETFLSVSNTLYSSFLVKARKGFFPSSLFAAALSSSEVNKHHWVMAARIYCTCWPLILHFSLASLSLCSPNLQIVVSCKKHQETLN